MGNPWIFSQVIHYLQYGEYIQEVDNTEKLDTILKHLDMLINEKGEDITKDSKEPLIRSGMKIKLENGTEYTLIVRGDTNCDGKITLTDLSKLVLEYNETTGFRLEGVALESGDLNCDGKLTLTDLSQLLVIYTNL